MKVILVGFGEVGKAILGLIKDYHTIVDILDIKIFKEPIGEYKDIDILLITIPYSKYFIVDVSYYQAVTGAKSTIIFSTVPIGTCSKLEATHSPIEGMHPFLQKSIEKATRWVGGYDKNTLAFFQKLPLQLKLVEKSEITEFLKLRSTTLYGVNIEFARYSNKICEEIGMEYELIKSFDQDYNALYNFLGMDQFSRYILDPPDGPIGGHCIRPNAEMLYEQFPDDMVKKIINGK